MYEIIKSVIESGRYELSDMLTKIDTIWLQGDISDDEKESLVTLAREKANPQNTYAPLQNQINSIFKNLGGIVDDMKALASRVTALEGGEPEPEEPQEEYPPYVQPTGAHDAYNTGDKITFDGDRYECLIDGCVWDPLTYPQGWKKVRDKNRR